MLFTISAFLQSASMQCVRLKFDMGAQLVRMYESTGRSCRA